MYSVECFGVRSIFPAGNEKGPGACRRTFAAANSGALRFAARACPSSSLVCLPNGRCALPRNCSGRFNLTRTVFERSFCIERRS